MKKIATIILASSLLWWMGKLPFTTLSTHQASVTLIDEAIFINVVRDLELLNSWLLRSYYPKETIDSLRHENHQKILALYEVDAQAFKDSVKHYLEGSPERALKVYEQVYLALEALSSF